MVGLVQCPKLAQSIRDQSRVLAGLKLRPESYRAAPSASGPTPVAPSAAPASGPLRPTAASLFQALSTRPSPVQAAAPSPASRRAFSSTPILHKALAHTHEDEILQTMSYTPRGWAAANAQEPKMGEAEEVVQGKRYGRTLNTLSLAGKLCVVTHPEHSIALTIASTFLEGGASDVALLAPPSSPAHRSKSLEPFPSPADAPFTPSYEGDPSQPPRLSPPPGAQLRELARAKGWRDARVVEVPLESYKTPDVHVALDQIERTYSPAPRGDGSVPRRVDVLCYGPPRDAEDAAASVSLLRVFADSMAAVPPSNPYDPPSRTSSVILLSTPYGSRVDLPQPQLLSHQSLAPQPEKKAGAAEMSGLAAVLGAEYAKRHVRFNTISPGFLKTHEVAALLNQDPGLVRQWSEATPLGRIGGVEELKGAAALLASDASRFTTGTNLVVDGGFSLV